MIIKNHLFKKEKFILLVVFFVLLFVAFFVNKLVRAAGDYGDLKVHTSFASYYYDSSGGGFDYGGVLVKVSGKPGGTWGYDNLPCSLAIAKCPQNCSGAPCDFPPEISSNTGSDGWVNWYCPANGPGIGFAACNCQFNIDLPLNPSNSQYGGSWSKYELKTEMCEGTLTSCTDGVWPNNNNCYTLLSWNSPYWRYVTPKWGNDSYYHPCFDWCENECPSKGAKEQKTENGITYERTCDYYDKDTCYDWGPWEKVSQPVCLSLCGCRNVNYSGPISASHFNRLRDDINRTEKEIKNNIDKNFNITRWTDDPLKAGDKVRAVHINEMCSAVKRIENKLKTGEGITCRDNIKAGEAVKSSHIKNICDDLNRIINKWNRSQGC